MILAALILALTADLEVLSVTPSKPEVQTDETFSFVVRVRNHGPDAAESVKVYSGTNASSLLRTIAAPPEWTCDPQGPRFGYGFACTTPSLPAGAEAELKVTLAAPQPHAVTYRVGAAISAKSTDPKRPGNRLDENLPLRVRQGNAELSMTARPAQDAERITFDARNDGPDDARDVMIVLEGASLASGNGWKCAPSATGVACTRATFGAKTTSAISARGKSAAKIDARIRAEQNYDSEPRNDRAKAP